MKNAAVEETGKSEGGPPFLFDAPLTNDDAERLGGCCLPICLAPRSEAGRPLAEHKNATLTLLDFEGRVFGLTCQHVIEALRSRSDDVLKTAGGAVLRAEDFRQPQLDLLTNRPRPDVAIIRLRPGWPESAGRKPWPLGENESGRLEESARAVVVGYPSEAKYMIGRRLMAPCLLAAAQIQGFPAEDRLTLGGLLDPAGPVKDLSGLSGGPVFWLQGPQRGLLGLARSAMPFEPVWGQAGHGLRLNLIVERITTARFQKWLASTGWA